MQEVDLKVKVKKSLFFWTLMSVLGIAAIPIMIVALVKGNWFIAIPSMVIVVFDFFGLPIGWTGFGTLVGERNVVLTITHDGVTNIRALANAMGRREKRMLAEVRTLIQKRYLRGYILNDDCTELIKPEKPKKQVVNTFCASCGAFVPPEEDSCQYCHRPVSR